MNKLQRIFAGLSCLLVLSSAAQGGAAEPLRWKFHKGDRLRYELRQQMKNQVDGGAAGIESTSVEQTFDMVWTIADVAADGTATIEQKFDRIQMKLALPQGQGLTYDSRSEAPPQGMAALIAPLFGKLLESPITAKMSPRGELLEATVPDALTEAIEDAPGANVMGDLTSVDGLKRLASRASFKLPDESPKIGDTSSSTVELLNPVIGKQSIETTFKFVGPAHAGGHDEAMESFSTQVKLTLTPLSEEQMKGLAANPLPAPTDVKLVDQKSTGEVLFSRERGLLIASHVDQKFVVSMVANGQPLTTTVEQTIDVTATPTDKAE